MDVAFEYGEGDSSGSALKATALRQDQSSFPIELSIREMVVDDAVMFTGVLRDITERTRAEQALLDALMHMGALNELDTLIITAQSAKTIATLALAIFCRLVGPCTGVIASFSSGGKPIILARSLDGAPDEFPTEFSADDLVNLSAGICLIANVHHQMVPIRQHSFTQPNPDGHATIWLPLRADGHLLGVVCIFPEPGHQLSASMLVMATSVADRLAIALHQLILRNTVFDQAQELKNATAAYTTQLELDNEELRSFSYSVSHDLRAPLRAIDGFARIFLEENAAHLTPEGLRQLAIIRDNSSRMGQLIDDLLAFSRLSRKSINAVIFPTRQLVEEVLAELKVDWPKVSRISIGPLPNSFGDRALLRQVWMNLLSNAFKYSSTRDMTDIEISAIAEDASWQFSVCDHGVGFDMAYYNRLFGVF